MIERLVVAIKDDVDAGALIDLAREVASPTAAVHLVTFVTVGTNEDEQVRLQQAEAALAARAAALRDAGYDVTTQSGVVAANAALQLLSAAESHEADLIVIGLVKRSRVGKALLGSDAQRILLSATCPVLGARLE